MPRKMKTLSQGKETKHCDPSLEDWPEDFYLVDVRTGVPYSPSGGPPRPFDDSLAVAAPLLPPHQRTRVPNLNEMLEKKFMDLRAQKMEYDERLRHPNVSVQTLFPDMFPSRQPQPAPSSPHATGSSRVALAGTVTPSPDPNQQSRTGIRIERASAAPGVRAPVSRGTTVSGSQSSTWTADRRLAGDQAPIPPPPAPANNDAKWATNNAPPDASSSFESSLAEADKSGPSVSQLWSTGEALDEASKNGDGQGSFSDQKSDMFSPLSSVSNQGQGVGLQDGNIHGWGSPFPITPSQQQAAFPSWPHANFHDPNQFSGRSSWSGPGRLKPIQGNFNIPWPYPSLCNDMNQGNAGIAHIDPSLLEPKQHARRNSRGHLKGSRRTPTEEHTPWTNPNASDPNLGRRDPPPPGGFPTFGRTPDAGNPSWSGTHTSSSFMGPSFTGHGMAGYPVTGAAGYSNTNTSPFDPGFAYSPARRYPVAGAPGYSSGPGVPPPHWQQQQQKQQSYPFSASYQHQYPPPPEPDHTPSRSGRVLLQPPQQASPYQKGHDPAQPVARKTTTGAGGRETSAAAAATAEPDYLWVPPAGYRHPRTDAGGIVRLGTARVAAEAQRLVADSLRDGQSSRPAETFARMWQTAAAGEAFRRGLRGPYAVVRRFVLEIRHYPDSLDTDGTARPVAKWGRAPDGREAWLDLHGRPTDRVDEATLIDMQGLYELEQNEKAEEDGEEEEEEG